jgi:hypothetical protein
VTGVLGEERAWARSWRDTNRPAQTSLGEKKQRLSQSLRDCTRDEAAQPFAIRARDVIHVTDAPLYGYDKILRSICRTLSIIGVANGNHPTTSIF